MADPDKENNYSNRMKRKLEEIKERMASLRNDLSATDSIDEKVAIHAALNKLNSDRINKEDTIAKQKQGANDKYNHRTRVATCSHQ